MIHGFECAVCIFSAAGVHSRERGVWLALRQSVYLPQIASDLVEDFGCTGLFRRRDCCPIDAQLFDIVLLESRPLCCVFASLIELSSTITFLSELRNGRRPPRVVLWASFDLLSEPSQAFWIAAVSSFAKTLIWSALVMEEHEAARRSKSLSSACLKLFQSFGFAAFELKILVESRCVGAALVRRSKEIVWWSEKLISSLSL